MDYQHLAQQSRIESDMLANIKSGIKAAMELPVRGPDFSQKLSTVRFITQSFQRHLEHLLALEENDGYMSIVLESSPQLGKRVDSLRLEHESFRRATGRIVHRLERVAPTDKIRFESICEEMGHLFQQLDAHLKKETALVQEALERDGGGEG